jgi:DNA polymerase V
VGKGTQRKLEGCGLYTMGDIARCSLGRETDYYNEDLLYKLFGVNAELLIDHAWGWEPCTMKEIKAFVPESSSVGEGQVLDCPSDYRRTGIVVREMARNLSLHLMEKGLVTDRIVLHIGFDRSNLPEMGGTWQGEVSDSYYGIRVPKPAHGTINLKRPTSSSDQISEAVMKLFKRIMDPSLLSKRIYLTAVHVEKSAAGSGETVYEQMDLFADFGMGEGGDEAPDQSLREKEEKRLLKEKKAQEAVLALQKKFGKNAVLRAADLQEGATARERNSQIGGHKA